MDHSDILRSGDGPAAGDALEGRYGAWQALVVELGAGDHDRCQAVLRWPLRAALEALRRDLQQVALDDFRFRMVCWCLTAPHTAKGSRPRPPEVPQLLRGRPPHGHA